MTTPTLSAHHYWTDAAWEREQRLLFGQHWQLLAPASRLPAVGDQLALTVARWPLLLVHTEQGIRGFHNVCRHRAGPLVHDGETHSGPRLRCRYHGWQYALTGERVATPGFGGDCPQADLIPLRVAVWRGLVFGCLSEEAPPLSTALGSLPEALAHLPLEAFVFHRHVEHSLSCNWKTYAENYLEGYHIPFVHPQLNREVDTRRYQVHVSSTHVSHEVPMRQADSAYEGFWAYLWPNVAINVYGAGLSLERIVPTGPRTMRIAYDFCFLADADAALREHALVTSKEVTEEDVRIVESVQRGLESGAYEHGWLSPRHEAGVEAFQRWVRRAHERKG